MKSKGPHSEAEAWLWLIVFSPGVWLLVAIVVIAWALS